MCVVNGEVNPTQAEGKVDSRLYGRRRAQTNHMKNVTQHYSAITQINTNVSFYY